ncbi:HAMP domain-containing histidine kinase [Rossellomorea vietnamensis]|uniref:histidine kinase n=1 Tax=Rossellomorea vietnamensis TaxID=218284 RepID=A0A5D4MAJ5_9BACI|nr:HAMP domain-containing sensor histidine kinase [Rossellomorea vietnamensis]TYR98518.1 HAMP domain-containing histidine kinase [Rossellomorea vietnamensis]
MNIHKRFMIQLFLQLMLIFFFVGLFLFFLFGMIGFLLSDTEAEFDLLQAEDYFISENVSLEDEAATISDRLKRLLEEQYGTLLVVSKEGEVLGGYPESQGISFKEGELAGLLLEKDPTLDYAYWRLDESDSDSPMVFLKKENGESLLLQSVVQQVDWQQGELDLQQGLASQLEDKNAWIQLVNSSGEVTDEYRAGEKREVYSQEDILELTQSMEESVSAHYDSDTQQTILLGMPLQGTAASLEETVDSKIGSSILLVAVLIFVLLLLITFWYAYKFGNPLLTMMKWIENLGKGHYQQPVNHVDQPILFKKNGKLKRKFKLYRDLITTLSQLTETLKENQDQRAKIKMTREEWISGISHDLKTPLSSIAGYSKMMESEEYNWSQSEVREFAEVIGSKASYMGDLLDDLTLTYRIKNGALPIVREEANITELVRRTVIGYMNNPDYSDKTLDFQAEDETILASVDSKWFQRITDNLVENALKYNPAGTTVTVSLSTIEDHLFQVMIADDGIGMDQQTVNSLFQRYYRGTNTSDSGSGTGLGMAITKQLVQLHQGSINVKSRPGEGTSIRILMPL